MKKLYLIILLIPFALWNCKNFDDRTKFDVTYVNRATFGITDTIISGTVISDTLLLGFEDDVRDHDSRLAKIEYVRMTSFSLEVDRLKSPELSNMNFLKSIQLFQIGDGKELLVAKTDTIPMNAGYFEMSIFFDIDEDMEKILVNDKSIYKVVYTYREAIPKKAVVKIAAKYEVDIRKMGI